MAQNTQPIFNFPRLPREINALIHEYVIGQLQREEEEQNRQKAEQQTKDMEFLLKAVYALFTNQHAWKVNNEQTQSVIEKLRPLSADNPNLSVEEVDAWFQEANIFFFNPSGNHNQGCAHRSISCAFRTEEGRQHATIYSLEAIRDKHHCKVCFTQ